MATITRRCIINQVPTLFATLVKASPVMVLLPIWYVMVSTTRICSSAVCLSKFNKNSVLSTWLNCNSPMWMSEIPTRRSIRRSIRNFRTWTKFSDLMLADPSTTKNTSWGIRRQSGEGACVAKNLRRWSLACHAKTINKQLFGITKIFHFVLGVSFFFTVTACG